MENAPKPPGSIPGYIADGLPKQSDATLREIQGHIDELLEARDEAEPDVPDTAEVVEDDDSNGKGSLVKEMVVCGKDSCKCQEGELHGPYLYRYWSESGKTKKKYVGKSS